MRPLILAVAAALLFGPARAALADAPQTQAAETMVLKLGPQSVPYTLPDGFCVPSPKVAEAMVNSFPKTMTIAGIGISCSAKDAIVLPFEVIVVGEAGMRGDRTALLREMREANTKGEVAKQLTEGAKEGADKLNQSDGVTLPGLEAKWEQIDDYGAYLRLTSDLSKSGLTLHMGAAMGLTVLNKRVALVMLAHYSGDEEVDDVIVGRLKGLVQDMATRLP